MTHRQTASFTKAVLERGWRILTNQGPAWEGFKYQLVTRQYINLFEHRDRNMELIIETLREHFHTNLPELQS